MVSIFSRIYFFVFTKEVLILSGQCMMMHEGVQNLSKPGQEFVNFKFQGSIYSEWSVSLFNSFFIMFRDKVLIKFIQRTQQGLILLKNCLFLNQLCVHTFFLHTSYLVQTNKTIKLAYNHLDMFYERIKYTFSIWQEIEKCSSLKFLSLE